MMAKRTRECRWKKILWDCLGILGMSLLVALCVFAVLLYIVADVGALIVLYYYLIENTTESAAIISIVLMTMNVIGFSGYLYRHNVNSFDHCSNLTFYFILLVIVHTTIISIICSKHFTIAVIIIVCSAILIHDGIIFCTTLFFCTYMYKFGWITENITEDGKTEENKIDGKTNIIEEKSSLLTSKV